jgi:hypothetical protein
MKKFKQRDDHVAKGEEEDEAPQGNRWNRLGCFLTPTHGLYMSL